jgi:hypothetical protein
MRGKTRLPLVWTTVLGVFFILLAVLITFLDRGSQKTTRLSIYILFGLGLSLLLLKKSSDAEVSYTLLNKTFKIIGGIAVCMTLILIDPIGKIFAADITLTGTTVYVHGKKGKMDMVLKNKGYVVMEIKGARIREAIGEQGNAHFENLLIGEKVRLSIDFSEPYEPIKADSVYTIDNGGKIYLPIYLTGIEKITGRVLEGDDPLAGVAVVSGALTGTTDATGFFSINVPEASQKPEYEVWFFKEGFKSTMGKAHPQTGQIMGIPMFRK